MEKRIIEKGEYYLVERTSTSTIRSTGPNLNITFDFDILITTLIIRVRVFATELLETPTLFY